MQLCVSIQVDALFWIIGCITDQLIFTPEEKFFEEEVPIDVGTTGGIIPRDIQNFKGLSRLLDEMKRLGEDFTKKTKHTNQFN